MIHFPLRKYYLNVIYFLQMGKFNQKEQFHMKFLITLELHLLCMNLKKNTFMLKIE